MRELVQDVRYALRTLARKPGFALTVVLTLAVGIGAVTSVFSVVNAVLLKPLPYPNADRLTFLWNVNPKLKLAFDNLPVSAGNYADWKARTTVFERLAVVGTERFTLTGLGDPVKIQAAQVSADFFQTMGVQPAVGRGFRPEDENPGSESVAVVGQSFLDRFSGGNPNIIGKTITLEGQATTVIGVMPAGFNFPRAGEIPDFSEINIQTDLWIPTRLTPRDIANRGQLSMLAVGLLRPGIGLRQAQTEMDAVTRQLVEVDGEFYGEFGVKLVPITEQAVGDVRAALLVFMGAVGFVLLIGCVNVANLLLAKASGRRREIAVRTALGASRSRIVRQLLTESVLLSLLGGLAAIAPAMWGVKALVLVSPSHLAHLHDIRTDWRVLAFALVVSFVTGLVFGLVPALQASKSNLTESLREVASGGAGRRDIRRFLVAAEVALSLVLLVAAGLAARSFGRLLEINPGFNPGHVVTFNIGLPQTTYPKGTKQISFFNQVVERMRALPEVEAVGGSTALPLSGTEDAGGFMIEGRETWNSAETPVANDRIVTNGYFRTLGIPLLRGRTFTEADTESTSAVVVVSESWARTFFPNENPFGKRVKRDDNNPNSPWMEIVGIVGDVRHSTLGGEIQPHMYYPLSQHPTASMTFAVRAKTSGEALLPALRDEIRVLDKDIPVNNVASMTHYVDESVSRPRFHMLLLGVFGLSALVLAVIGVHGVVSYSVAQRTREIGIRMALGAQRRQVLALVLKQGMPPVLVGTMIGAGAALGVTPLMKSLLYGVPPTDPVTFAVISTVLAAAGFAACLIPARRATKTDPATALRTE